MATSVKIVHFFLALGASRRPMDALSYPYPSRHHTDHSQLLTLRSLEALSAACARLRLVATGPHGLPSPAASIWFTTETKAVQDSEGKWGAALAWRHHVLLAVQGAAGGVTQVGCVRSQRMGFEVHVRPLGIRG